MKALLCSQYPTKLLYWKIPVLLGKFAPYYFRHYFRRSFRRNIVAINYIWPQVSLSRRHRDAFYDSLLNLIIDGYTEITGFNTAQETGQLLVVFNKLLSSIDDLLEDKSHSNDPVPFDELLGDSAVQERLQIWRKFTKALGVGDELARFLRGEVEAYYAKYLDLVGVYRATGDYYTLVESVKLDSGGQLRTLAYIISFFNGHTPTDALLREFHAVGMIGKFVDDMIDLAFDIKRGHANLLYALVSQNEAEREALHTAICNGERLSGIWWRQHCPITLSAYCRDIDSYFRLLISSKLRMTCEIMMIPALFGRGYAST